MNNVILYGHDKKTGAEVMRIEEPWGVEYRKTNNKLHREDGPAVEMNDGTKSWYINGKRHRDDGPAIERKNGSKSWYQFDTLHRDDGPAVIKSDGTEQWYWWGENMDKKEYLKYSLEDAEYKKNIEQPKLLTDKPDINKNITNIREASHKLSYSFKLK